MYMIMELTLKRILLEKTYTMGRLYVNGEPLCDTLEPIRRDIGPGGTERKVAGRTAIPEGRYPVVITYSDSLYGWYPLLLHVPQFADIRIHAGYSVEQTRGSILVGYSPKPGTLIDSRLWLHRLKKRITEAKEHGEGVWITIS